MTSMFVGPRVADAERIAVLRANALGDFVVALPALEALRAAYPSAWITLLGRPLHEALLERRPSPVDEVVVLPDAAIGDEVAKSPGLDREALIAALAGRHFDVAIQLHGGGRMSNAFLCRLGARVTVGSRTPDAPELDRWVPYELYQWEVARYLEVVALVGATPVVVEPRLTVIAADRVALAAELPELEGSGYVVLHPGASDPRRRWPVERFADVGRALRSRGRRLVVTGVPAEAALVDALVDGLDGDALRADRLSLPGLLALVAGADLVVSNDTGPLHLAVATEAPTVGLFWVGNLINAGPFSRRRHRPLVSWRVACPVCGLDSTEERCPHDDSFVADIPTSAVIAAADSLLDSAAEPWIH